MSVSAVAETLIKQRLNVVIDIEPKQYSNNLVVSGSKELQKLKSLSLENKNAIIKTFNGINDFLGNDSICRGGGFAINPSYYYKDGKKYKKDLKQILFCIVSLWNLKSKSITLFWKKLRVKFLKILS